MAIFFCNLLEYIKRYSECIFSILHTFIKMSTLGISHVPIIDIETFRKGSTKDRRAFANNLTDICHQIGFFSLVNHGLDDLQIRVKKMMRQLFLLDESKKKSIAKINQVFLSCS